MQKMGRGVWPPAYAMHRCRFAPCFSQAGQSGDDSAKGVLAAQYECYAGQYFRVIDKHC